MRLVFQFVGLFVLACGCGMPTARSPISNVAFKWNELNDSIDNAYRKSTNSVLLFAFTADWSPTGGPIFRHYLQHTNVVSFLTGRSVEGYLVDCTLADSPGMAAIEKYGVDASPISIAIWNRGEVIKFIRPSAITDQGIITAIAPHIQ